jgi:hypothetical protein
MDSDGRSFANGNGAATHNGGPTSAWGQGWPNPNTPDSHWWNIGTMPA